MKLVAYIITTLFLVADVLAYKYPKFDYYGEGLIEVRGCHQALYTSAIFCQGQTSRGYTCYCRNKNAMASLSGCIQLLRPDPTNVFNWFVKHCKLQNVTITKKDLFDSIDYLKTNGRNFTEAKSIAAKFANATNTTLPKSGPGRVNVPIWGNRTTIVRYNKAWAARYGTFNWSYWFSNILYMYWAFVFVLAAVCNWSVVIFPSLRTTFNGKISKVWRKYVTLPALYRRKKTNEQGFLGILDFLVPTRLESIVLTGFFWLTFLFNALYYPWFQGNHLFKDQYMMYLRSISDRTGIIGTLLIPLLILLGGRNNFLQWVTRWKFATFITYHRWIGRVVLAMIFVHSVGYSVYEIKLNKYAETFAQEYIIYGTAAMVAGGIMPVQGLLFLRRRWYEIFLVVHILMAVVFIWGTWIHIRMRMYMEWMYATIAIWAFDRLVRFVRMAFFGVQKATVTLLADDCLRVVVPKPSYWKSVPGGHAWVYFFHSWYFWQSHPFTFLDSTVEGNQIVFILKSKKGATNYLAKTLAKRPEKTGTIRICVEGPYGESCSVKLHDNVVFVAGGNGIPGIFSECYALAKKSANNATQRVKLNWVLREILTIEWVWQELHALKETKVEATIYITRPEGGNEDVLLERMQSKDESSSSDEKDSYKEKKDILEALSDHFPHITFKYGRPLMDGIVDEETAEASKAVAFITCGHPIMVDDLRYAVVQKIDKTEKRVDFFEQLQVWA